MEYAAFTIDEFCRAYRISRAHYFNLRNAGLGPRVMQVGKRVVITKEAAAEWVKQCEAAASSGDA